LTKESVRRRSAWSTEIQRGYFILHYDKRRMPTFGRGRIIPRPWCECFSVSGACCWTASLVVPVTRQHCCSRPISQARISHSVHRQARLFSTLVSIASIPSNLEGKVLKRADKLCHGGEGHSREIGHDNAFELSLHSKEKPYLQCPFSNRKHLLPENFGAALPDLCYAEKVGIRWPHTHSEDANE